LAVLLRRSPACRDCARPRREGCGPNQTWSGARRILGRGLRGGRSEAVSGRGFSNAISVISRPPRVSKFLVRQRVDASAASVSCLNDSHLFARVLKWVGCRRGIGPSRAASPTVAAGSLSNSIKRRIGSFAGLLAGRRWEKTRARRRRKPGFLSTMSMR
jgi:hypothetical protein